MGRTFRKLLRRPRATDVLERPGRSRHFRTGPDRIHSGANPVHPGNSCSRMSDVLPTEKLQPCLLDRLTDRNPGATQESRTERVMKPTEYRASVLRDLSWLLNTNA